MLYNTKEMQSLFDSVSEKLEEEDFKVVSDILHNYNKLYIIAREKIEYIKRKEKQYVDESNECIRLEVENRQLKDKIAKAKAQIYDLRQEKWDLETKILRFKNNEVINE